MSTQAAVNFQPRISGFEHVKKYFDPNMKMDVVKILPGEYYVTNQKELISTVLGSCISACVRDKRTGIGGMNHFMIPSHGRELNAKDKQLITRYGVYAMEHLINDIFKNGGTRKNIEIKLFGGGNIMTNQGDIGKQNILFVREFVNTEGYLVTSEDMGDIYPRKVNYCPMTGKARVKKLVKANKREIERQELNLQNQLDAENKEGGEIDLF